MGRLRSRRPRSLLEKVSGPKAVPIDKLVERGEAASQEVRATFGEFLKLRVSELEGMLKPLTAPDAPNALWTQFYTVVHDIRGSGALARNLAVIEFCISLERLLSERDPADARMHMALLSHINALNLVISRGTPDKASQALLAAELSRAVDSLPLRRNSD